jgi:hypothetical protein
MTRSVLAVVALAALAGGVSASAHHSYAGFFRSKRNEPSRSRASSKAFCMRTLMWS